MFVRKIITVCLVKAVILLLMTACDPLIDFDHVFRHRANNDQPPHANDPGPGGPNGDNGPNGSGNDGNGAPVAMTMVRIPPDNVSGPPFDFTMGDDDFDSWNAQPAHQVTLTQGFYMSAHEVTQWQFEEVMGFNHSGFRGYNLPVESVTWYEALVFSNRLSIRNVLSPAYEIRCAMNDEWTTEPARWGEIPRGVWNDARWDAVRIVVDSNGYRLPTEAQWEFAARAGTTTPWNTGDSINITQANFWDGSGQEVGMTTTVGSYAPNAWGLYDMHGNVWEWVWDWFGSYSSAPQTDPSGASSGTDRVFRGGGWGGDAQDLRSAHRNSGAPGFGWDFFLGFRVVRP